jgi:hypothetical protein
MEFVRAITYLNHADNGRFEEMVRWIKRLAALGNGILIFALFYHGHTEVALFGGFLNLIWVLDEKLPHWVRGLFRSSALGTNTVLSAYAALTGLSLGLALLIAGNSLLVWNAGLFLKRWGNAPRVVQYQYLRRVGTLIAFGLLAGLLALALQGHFTLLFLPILLLMLSTGILWLRIISQALKNRKPG